MLHLCNMGSCEGGLAVWMDVQSHYMGLVNRKQALP
jgi:hypothetical protein